MSWVTVCPLAALSDSRPLGTVVHGVALCLVRVGDEVFTVHDECTHEAVRLSEGDVDDHTIECWRHGSQFDLRTGAALNLPAVTPVATYPTRVTGESVEVELPR